MILKIVPVHFLNKKTNKILLELRLLGQFKSLLGSVINFVLKLDHLNKRN